MIRKLLTLPTSLFFERCAKYLEEKRHDLWKLSALIAVARGLEAG
jgi:hypothetical protein